MKKLLTIGLVFLSMAFANVVLGQENITRKSVNATGFNAIQASGIAHVYLTKGDQEKVEVEINEKFRQYARVSVEDQVLNVKLDLNERSGKRDLNDLEFNVYVTYKSLKSLTGSGATHFSTRNKLTAPSLKVNVSGANNCNLDLDAGNLSIDASGASNIELSGKVEMLNVNASGACNVRAYELNADSVDAEVSGVSNAYVTAQKKLDARASGLSHIKYKGDPDVGTKDVSRMSSLKKQ
jgi:hypothetical protein